jgi:hypothetical protein
MKNQTFQFERTDEDSLIKVDFWFGRTKLTFALDSGASHTVIDLSQVLIAGYELKDALGTVELETGKGILEAYIFKVPLLEAIGISRKNVEICSYDFFTNHIFTDFDGVLGLDFLEDNKICIDFPKSIITVS